MKVLEGLTGFKYGRVFGFKQGSGFWGLDEDFFPKGFEESLGALGFRLFFSFALHRAVRNKNFSFKVGSVYSCLAILKCF